MEIRLPVLLTKNDSLASADFEAGTILLVDKPAGLSSFAVVRKVRRLCRVRKAGHCGTLDPAATGLLILLTGKATRQQGPLMKQDKEYLATILLGVQTDTWDLGGHIISRCEPPPVSREEVSGLLRRHFSGDIEQVPPAYSALKSGGVPNYRRARRGEIVVLPARKVAVHRMDLEEWAFPEFSVRLSCSSGFYVRSLAHELGQLVGCGAALKSLVRTRVGDYHLDDAWRLDDLELLLSTKEPEEPTCPN